MAGPTDRVWILVVAYVLVATVTLIANQICARRRERLFWLVTSGTLLLLGVGKQLNLQGQFTDWLRTDARAHHLYGSRAIVQYLFVLVVIAGIVLLIFQMRDWVKSSRQSVATAAVAMTMLLAFILVRAASLHVLDKAMTMQMAGLRSGWWVELAGLSIIALAAGAFVMEQRR